jgi:hypothetical protein
VGGNWNELAQLRENWWDFEHEIKTSVSIQQGKFLDKISQVYVVNDSTPLPTGKEASI